MQGCCKDCLCVSYSIQPISDQLLYSPTVSNASPLSQSIVSMSGSDIRSPTSLSVGPLLATLLFFPSFLHPTKFCVDLYVPFQWSLPVFSWCSARSSVSEGVFPKHPWREMYPMFTYFSAILSPPCLVLEVARFISQVLFNIKA